jgi:hypothetical protein
MGNSRPFWWKSKNRMKKREKENREKDYEKRKS